MKKPKTNRKGDEQTSYKYDQCQTPFYALDPLLSYLPEKAVVWEPASGEGNIARKLELHGYKVIATDLLTGQNFFSYEPESYDIVITNPPFSVKYRFIERCYELGKPFALLMPIDVFGAKQSQSQFERYGTEVILLDKRVNFKMPDKGYTGNGAQFSTAWFTWGLGIGSQLTYGKIVRYDDQQTKLNIDT